MSRKTPPRPRTALDKPRGGGLSKEDGVQLAIHQLPQPPILMSVVEAAWWRVAVGTLGIITRIVETSSVHDLKWSAKMLDHYRRKALDIAAHAPGRMADHGKVLQDAVQSAVLPPRGEP